jgi:AraC-like DNA-binding protein
VRYREFPPPAPLRPFVDALWWLTSDGAIAPPDAGTVIPDGSAEIVLAFADPVRPSPRARPVTRFVAGQMERPWRVTYTGAVDLIGIRLHPAAVRPVLGVGPGTLTNQVVNLKRVSPELDRALAAIDAGAVDRRLTDLGGRLGAMLHRAPPPNPLITTATAEIRRHRGRVRIAALAVTLGCGRRRLERRFRDEVGLSPKRWARVIRFQHALEEAATPNPDWAQVASVLGYADQAHLTREFREFAGIPPRAAWPTTRRRRRISSRQR